MAAVDVERRLHLSLGRLGLLLTASVAAGGVVAAAFGSLTHRMGTARALAGALVVWGACVLGAAAAPGTTAFAVFFVAALVLAGTVDAAMNTAVALGSRGDPRTMVRFHALFNAGALVGAGLTGLLLFAGGSWRPVWAGVAVVSFVLAAFSGLPGASRPSTAGPGPRAAAGGRPVAGDDDPGRFGWRAVRALRLRALAAVFLGTALVEGGIDTWGVLYLRTHLAAGVLLGAGAYVVGQAVAVAVRWSSAPHVGRIGARAGIAVGAGTAAVGLALEAASPRPAGAALGLMIAIGGIALCWPLVMAVVSSAATAGDTAGPAAAPGEGLGGEAGDARRGAGRLAAAVGAFTAVGYLGWVAGPAMVGWVADAAGLGTGLFLLAGVAAGAAGLVLATPASARAR